MSHGIDVLKINKKVNYEMHYNPKDFETALDLYNILLKSIISSNDKAVGHKVTGCEHNIINILNQTDIKVIYIYRDPRDVIPSALKKKFIPNVELGCMQWNNAINTALSIKHINYFTLKFEDLVASKTGLVQRLSDFLNVKITLDIDKILHYDEKFISNSSYDDINSLFSPIAAYRWKTNKDPNLTKTVYDLCRQEILKAGYQQP